MNADIKTSNGCLPMLLMKKLNGEINYDSSAQIKSGIMLTALNSGKTNIIRNHITRI